MYDVLTDTIQAELPEIVTYVMGYLVSPGVVLPLFMLLGLTGCYIVLVTRSLHDANRELRMQLQYERTAVRRKIYAMGEAKHAREEQTNGQGRTADIQNGHVGQAGSSRDMIPAANHAREEQTNGQGRTAENRQNGHVCQAGNSRGMILAANHAREEQTNGQGGTAANRHNGHVCQAGNSMSMIPAAISALRAAQANQAGGSHVTNSHTTAQVASTNTINLGDAIIGTDAQARFFFDAVQMAMHSLGAPVAGTKKKKSKKRKKQAATPAIKEAMVVNNKQKKVTTGGGCSNNKNKHAVDVMNTNRLSVSRTQLQEGTSQQVRGRNNQDAGVLEDEIFRHEEAQPVSVQDGNGEGQSGAMKPQTNIPSLKSKICHARKMKTAKSVQTRTAGRAVSHSDPDIILREMISRDPDMSNLSENRHHPAPIDSSRYETILRKENITAEKDKVKNKSSRRSRSCSMINEGGYLKPFHGLTDEDSEDEGALIDDVFSDGDKDASNLFSVEDDVATAADKNDNKQNSDNVESYHLRKRISRIKQSASGKFFPPSTTVIACKKPFHNASTQTKKLKNMVSAQIIIVNESAEDTVLKKNFGASREKGKQHLQGTSSGSSISSPLPEIKVEDFSVPCERTESQYTGLEVEQVRTHSKHTKIPRLQNEPRSVHVSLGKQNTSLCISLGTAGECSTKSRSSTGNGVNYSKDNENLISKKITDTKPLPEAEIPRKNKEKRSHSHGTGQTALFRNMQPPQFHTKSSDSENK